MSRIETNTPSKQDLLQSEMVERGLAFYEKETIGYYDLSIRFGKCKTTIELLKKIWMDTNIYILIAYPDNKLKNTWIEEQKLWGSLGLNVSYVNFDSLKKWADDEYPKVEHFICDEWHSLSDSALEYAKKISKKAEYTTCLSGTVDQETKDRWNIKEIGRYTTEQGQKDGILADYRVTVHVVSLDNTVRTKDNSGKMRTEKERYNAYTAVIDRMKMEKKDTMFLALARNRISLNSIGKRDYVKRLLGQMQDKRVIVFTGLTAAADSLGIPSYHSKSGKKSTTFEDFQNRKIDKLALGAMGKVGVTFTGLDGTILTNFTYNQKETAQILQRAIKLDYSGKCADLHIICLDEKPELKKVKESLSMLLPHKIIYLK